MKYRMAKVIVSSKHHQSGLRVVDNETSELIKRLDLNKSKYSSYLPGDQVLYRKNEECVELKSLSCTVLKVSKFKRNLNSILKKLANKDDPLNRVLVLHRHANFWCIPHEKDLRHTLFK